MIQRIQTVYLLVSLLLTGLLLWLPLADITSGDNFYIFDIFGVHSGGQTIFNGTPLLVFVLIIILLHLVVVLMYKKRIMQIRILVFTIILLLGLFGMFFYFAYMGFDGARISFKIPMVFPLIVVILDYLAIRGIGKDEALIRSLNRIR